MAANVSVQATEEEQIQTPLFHLKARREELVKNLTLDLRVPRWDSPELWVRYRPVDATKLTASVERRQKTKTNDQSILLNADILVESCVGIYARHPDFPGQELSLREDDPFGKLTRFDPDLATSLGIPDALGVTAAMVCRKLYLTDGDLVDAATQVLEWSAATNEKADEDFSTP